MCDGHAHASDAKGPFRLEYVELCEPDAPLQRDLEDEALVMAGADQRSVTSDTRGAK